MEFLPVVSHFSAPQQRTRHTLVIGLQSVAIAALLSLLLLSMRHAQQLSTNQPSVTLSTPTITTTPKATTTPATPKASSTQSTATFSFQI